MKILFFLILCNSIPFAAGLCRQFIVSLFVYVFLAIYLPVYRSVHLPVVFSFLFFLIPSISLPLSTLTHVHIHTPNPLSGPRRGGCMCLANGKSGRRKVLPWRVGECGCSAGAAVGGWRLEDLVCSWPLPLWCIPGAFLRLQNLIFLFCPGWDDVAGSSHPRSCCTSSCPRRKNLATGGEDCSALEV